MERSQVVIRGRAPSITREALVALIAEGRSTAEIAAAFGVQSPAVTRACHRFKTGLPASGRVASARHAEPTRAEDERLLDWLARARAGWTVGEIARAHGYASGASVQARIKAVELADLAESGEPARIVAQAYPKRGPSR